MKKIILIPIFSLLFITFTYAQSVSLFARGNLSIGTQYQSIEYFNQRVLYSGGGGMGLELGIQNEVIKNLNIRASIGYQLNLAIQAENINGNYNSSSAVFNRKFLSIGLSNGMELTHRTITHVVLGAGVQYNTPGKLKRIENEMDLGDISYKSQLGFYLEGGLSLKLSDNLALDPTLRYRFLSFEAEDMPFFSINPTDPNLEEYNANGFEFALTLIRRLQ